MSSNDEELERNDPQSEQLEEGSRDVRIRERLFNYRLNYPQLERLSRITEIIGVGLIILGIISVIGAFLAFGVVGVTVLLTEMLRFTLGVIGAGASCFVASFVIDGTVEWMREN